jgi:8-oxo-dGTP pyrophosphatase MutT (NUDIX family)
MRSAGLEDTEFSSMDFAVRASRLSRGWSDEEHGDHVLNPDIGLNDPAMTFREAAVLVPVVDRGREATVILTQRTAHLRTHSGQVAFPGGSIDPTDPSPEAAALRETAEEIGLEAAPISIVGRLPVYRTGSGYRITPVLATVTPPFDLTVNPDEVADVFEVPLAFLMDPANHVRDSRIWQGRERFFYTMPYGGHHIWGVTAGIIRSLYERLYR